MFTLQNPCLLKLITSLCVLHSHHHHHQQQQQQHHHHHHKPAVMEAELLRVSPPADCALLIA